MIKKAELEKIVINLFQHAVTELPVDVKQKLEEAYYIERSKIAKLQLKTILDNIKLARTLCAPICQDTGIPLIYVTIGYSYPVKIKFMKTLQDALKNAVISATRCIPLRPNVVNPISRENTGSNIGIHMPYIHFEFTEGDTLEITILPKGAGSENMSALSMLSPTDGLKGLKKFVLQTVVSAGGKPCPPIIVGIGIGGSADIAPVLAKKAVLRNLNARNKNRTIAELEKDLYKLINKTNIGTMGLGGKITALGVNIECAHCHTASLPVAINIQCWAARRRTAVIDRENNIKYR
jgi:fumarate hydratase subunit alpha